MRRTVRTIMAVGLAATSVLGAMFGNAQAAQAATAGAGEDAPTSFQLLRLCNNGADYCKFHITSGPAIFTGERHQIGRTVINCGPGAATQSVSWTDTTGESNSLGISAIVANEGELAASWGAFKSEVEFTYGHRWGSIDAATRSTSVTVPAGEKAWLERATPMQRISGRYELHFGKRYYGHYYWYVPFTVTAAAPETVDIVTQHSAALTPGEKEACR